MASRGNELDGDDNNAAVLKKMYEEGLTKENIDVFLKKFYPIFWGFGNEEEKAIEWLAGTDGVLSTLVRLVREVNHIPPREQKVIIKPKREDDDEGVEVGKDKDKENEKENGGKGKDKDKWKLKQNKKASPEVKEEIKSEIKNEIKNEVEPEPQKEVKENQDQENVNNKQKIELDERMRKLYVILFRLSENEILFQKLCEGEVLQHLIQAIELEEGKNYHWSPIGTLWNLAAESRGSVQIMLQGGILPLLETLSKSPTQVDHQVVGTVSALTYTSSVRDLVWQQLRSSTEGLTKLIGLIKPTLWTIGISFNAAASCSFLLLAPENIPILRNLNCLKKIGDFCYFEINAPNPGFEISELEVAAYAQLFLSEFVEVKRFLAYFYARYTIDKISVNPHCERAIAAIRLSCIPQIRALSWSRDPRTAELASIALANLGEEYMGTIQQLVDSINLTNAKAIGKRLQSENFDLPLLVNPKTNIEDIQTMIIDTDNFKRGDILRILTAIRELRRQHEDDIKVGLEVAEKATQRDTFSNQTISFSIQETTMPTIFLSYSWTNKQIVLKLKECIEREGLTCWMDDSSMTGGVQLFEEIDQGVSNSRIFLACVSNSYGSSENCRREVLLASDRKKLIVPTIVGQTDPYPPKGSLGPLLAGKLYIDLSDDLKFEKGVSQLVRTIKQSL